MFLDDNVSVGIQTGLVGVASFLLAKWILAEKPLKRLPKGPKQYPIFGNALSLWGNQDVHVQFKEWADEYGDMCTIRLGRYDAVLLNSRDVIRELFVENGDLTSYRATLFIHKLMDSVKGIMNNMGPSWKEQRRTAISSLREFGLGKKSLEERILEEADDIVAHIDCMGEDPVDLDIPLVHASTNVICSIIFGDRYETDDPEFVYLMNEFRFIFKQGGLQNITLFFPELLIFVPIMFPFLLVAIRRFLKLQEFFRSKIQDHRSSFDPENIRDFIDLYLEAEQDGNESGSHSEGQMFQTMFDLFIAGAETTSTTLRWALIFLIHCPDVQERCREEIIRVLGSSRRPEFRDRGKMPYVEATIQETLRRGNVAPLSLFHTTSEPMTFRGYKFPKNLMLVANFYSVHMDPEIFEDPESFKPERWLDENGCKTNTAFLPFGVGPRECPGKGLAHQEIFLILVTLLQQFRFSAPDPYNLPPLMGRFGITHYPDKYLLKATRL